MIRRRAAVACLGLLWACAAPPDPLGHLATTSRPAPVPTAAAQPSGPSTSGPRTDAVTSAGADAPAAPHGPLDPYPLFRRYPTLGKKLARAPLGRWPTPVTPLPGLAAELGAASLHVKRDDHSAEPYGGGKARKLELLLGQALAEGRSQVITFGGMGSHHAAATAIYGRQLGLQVHLFLLPQPRTPEVCRVVQTCQAEGAKLRLAGRQSAAERQARQLAAKAPTDTLILPAGGSSPLGNVGFINAALELADQIEAGQLPVPNELFIAMGTMGSAVGLAIGLSVAELDTTIVAVRTSSHVAASWPKLTALHRDTVAWLRDRDPSFPAMRLDETRLRIESRYLGRGYALPTAQGTAASRLAAEHGLGLDDTYTAKAFAAVLAAPPDRGQPKHLLFWHTHSARPLDPRGADLQALPASIRGYAACGSQP